MRLGVKILAAIVVAVVAAAVLAAYLLAPHSTSIEINAPYAFIVYDGQWYIAYYDESGAHKLGPYSQFNNPDMIQAMNVVNQFNQKIVPQHSGYQPLDSIIVVGAGDAGKQGVVEIPVSGNTIDLKDINPGYYTLVAVPQQYTTQFMQALDTGYKLSAIVSAQGLQYLQYNNPQVWKLVLETVNLMQYSPQNVGFGSSYILVTNNNTLIPYAPLRFHGLNLSFVNTNIPYNGS